MTAAWPSARSASTSAIDAAYDGRRASWCSQSRVAASRCSGRWIAWASSAARAEFAAASARRTCSGSTDRALAVDSWASGTKTTGSTSGCTGRWTVRVVPARRPTTTGSRPPWTLAVALSGCPSRREARVSAKREVDVGAVEPAGDVVQRLRRDDPVTIAVADDPSPRPCGTSLRHSRCSPGRRLDAELGPGDLHGAVHEVGGVERHRVGTLALDRDDETRASATVARQVSHTPRAQPTESKPGPRFALLAGTRTSTAAPTRSGVAAHVTPRGRAPPRR